ncbi:DUF4097 family beta strand repeat-containing protein [Dictyobacter formicarum]|uniref:DUF4097 domain-containing protein n=1 Tax=Dictyobacter formicarum TaxID=2778368 RepID=A0ABQ3VSR7_9CHLR|nr:DUF4097 family beta strand repeat-containing protein [Dictyobacter formicarum]GHO89245.1 hypothetical protein KSZ_72510 [Dictyobacter formicarum]
MSQQQSQFDEKWPQERPYAPQYYAESQVQRDINRDPREQPVGPQEYYSPVPPDGYTASYGQGEKLRPRPPRRTHRTRNWIIGIIVVLALVWGASASVRSVHHPMNMESKPQPVTTSFSYTGSQLIFHGIKGNVHIHTGNTSQVQVNTSGNINVKGSSDNGVITLQQVMSGKSDFGSNDGGNIDLTVPKDMQLTVDMPIGPVDIDGVTGKLNISAGDGEISVNNTTLHDGSTLKTANGPIRFDGSLDPKGSYDFETYNGSVSVRLPKGDVAAVSTNTMHGDVNNHLNTATNDPNAAIVTIKTLNGSIDVDNQ